MFRAALLMGLAGCATASTVVAPRTRPVVESSQRQVPPALTPVVLVVSEATLEVLSPDLVFQPCAEGPAPCAERLADLQVATQTLERALFDAGLQPMTQSEVARLVTSAPVARGLRELLDRGQATLLEAATLLGAASNADRVVVVKQWRTGFVPSALAAAGATLCPLVGFLELVGHDRQGRVLWEGRATVQTTDSADVALTTDGASAVVSPLGSACAGRAGCGACAPPASGATRALSWQASQLLSVEWFARQKGDGR